MLTLPKRLKGFFAQEPKPSKQQAQEIAGQTSPVAWRDSMLYNGADFPQYNPDDLIGRKGHDVYDSMMRDEQVKAVVHFKRDAITARDHYFTFPDGCELSETEQKRRIQLCEKLVTASVGSWSDSVNFVLKAMWQGFSFTEIVKGFFEFEGATYIGVKRLMPKPFETFKYYTTPQGEIIKAVQEVGLEEIDIDLNRFIRYVQNPDKDEFYGRSELREAYRSWFSKDVTIKLWNIYLERVAAGFTYLTPKQGKTVNVRSEEYAQIQRILDRIQGATGMLLPTGYELETVTPTSTDAYERATQFHDLGIAKALLVPNLLGVSNQGQTGAYAQSNTQLEAFFWTLDADTGRIEEAFNEQLFKPLHLLNFADGLGPEYRYKPISDRKKHELAKSWGELVGKKAVEPSESDEAHLRTLFEMPEKTEPLGINSPPPPQGGEMPNPEGTPPTPVGQGEDAGEAPNETLGASGIVRTNAAAFNRAKRRVHFNVIDRKSEDLVNDQTAAVEQRVAAMVVEGIERIEAEKLGSPAGGADKIHKFNFNSARKSTVRNAFNRSVKRFWAYGTTLATDEVERAASEFRRRRFSGRAPEITEVNMARLGDKSTDWLNDTAYRLTGNLTEAMREIVQNILSQSLIYSWPTKTVTRKIYDALLLAGTISLNANAEGTGRAEEEVIEALQEAKLTPHRIRTVLRTAGFSAINEARYNMFTDPAIADFVEALEYTAILDTRTTQICRHLDDRVYAADAPEWDGFRPPNHYNCRSLLLPVTVLDTDVVGKDHAKGSRYSNAPTMEPAKGFGGDPEA